MIVKNEAGFLARCLESIRPAADQIVVVDTGSIDGTVEVARSFGAEVVFAAWRDDFSWARNVSLEKASCSWILWLDADDVVPAESVARLSALKKEKPDRVFGLTVRNERPSGTGTEFVQARMFPNRGDIRFERRVHEQMMPSALRLGLAMEQRDVVIEHHGYADPETHKRKARRNIALLLEDYDQNAPDPVTAVEIADAYQLTENWDEALKWYDAVLVIPGCETATPAIASQAYYGIGGIHNRLGNLELALAPLAAAVRLAPWRPDVLYVLAVCHDCAGAFGEAISCLRRILGMEAAPGQVGVDFRAVRIKATLRLLRLLTEQNRFGEALAEARAALSMHSDRPEISVMAAKVFLAQGNLMEALKLFERSLSLALEGNLDSYLGLCLIYRTANRMETARQSLDSIKPLYGDLARYWAFRRHFLGEHESAPAQFAVGDLEKDWGLIRRDFFNKA